MEEYQYTYSVIIPAYNADRTLSRCVNSLIPQLREKGQIIIVDDGSTDQTPRLGKSLSEKNSFIKYIRIPNGGVSNARNVGLKYAQGKWISFVDSDDWVPENSWNDVEHVLNDEIDALYCNYQCSDSPGPYTQKYLELSSEDMLKATFDRANYATVFHKHNVKLRSSFFTSSCFKFFRQDILKKQSIQFDTELFLSEDFLFNVTFLESSSRIGFYDICVYYYDNNQESVTHRVTERHLVNRCKLIDVLLRQTFAQRELMQSRNAFITSKCIEIIGDYDQAEEKETRKLIKSCMLDRDVQQVLHDLRTPKLSEGRIQNKYALVQQWLLRNRFFSVSVILGYLYKHLKRNRGS